MMDLSELKPTKNPKTSQAQGTLYKVSHILSFFGNTLVSVGCLALVLGMLGVYDMDIFAFGLSSGVRIIGTVAIAGCLFSAIGYGITDYMSK